MNTDATNNDKDPAAQRLAWRWILGCYAALALALFSEWMMK